MSTTAPVIPAHIWQADQPLWKGWITSLDISFHTKEGYKRIVVHFYNALDLPIQQVTEQHIADYEKYLQEDGKSERTIRTYMTIVRKYWRFVHGGVQA